MLQIVIVHVVMDESSQNLALWEGRGAQKTRRESGGAKPLVSGNVDASGVLLIDYLKLAFNIIGTVGHK
jgi:hypothetical protein